MDDSALVDVAIEVLLATFAALLIGITLSALGIL